MNKSIILLVAAALSFTGCNKLGLLEAEHKKKIVAARDAAAEAQARFALRLAAKDLQVSAKTGKAGEALAVMLCSSRELMDDIETSMDLLEALSGPGGDPDERKRNFLEARNKYGAIIKKELPARGATYEELAQYALGRDTAEQKQKFKAIVAEKCPRGDKVLVERTAGGLMNYLAGAVPK